MKGLQNKEEWRFLFWSIFFVLEILTFLYNANEESGDIINCFAKTVKYCIKNIPRNIWAVFFRLGTRNAHHKGNRVTPFVSLSGKPSWLQSLSVKNQISAFSTLYGGTEILKRTPVCVACERRPISGLTSDSWKLVCVSRLLFVASLIFFLTQRYSILKQHIISCRIFFCFNIPNGTIKVPSLLTFWDWTQ